MPAGVVVTTNLTIEAVGSDTFGVDAGKAAALDNANAVATAIGQSAIMRLTDIPADFHEAISIKVRLDNVAFI